MLGISLLYNAKIIIKHQNTPEKVLNEDNKDLIFFFSVFFLECTILHSSML